MPELKLVVLSLRYSSWSMRAWLALTRGGASFKTETAVLPALQRQTQDDSGMQSELDAAELARRQSTGSVTGLYPVLWVGKEPIHESLAICEWAAETHPDAQLWPEDGMARARARAVSAEMAAGFSALRAELPCHVFGSVVDFEPSAEAKRQIARVFQLWSECLERSGGPFLFGGFSIADCMYFPVLTRFRTYEVELPKSLRPFANALWSHDAVQALLGLARHAPALGAYDAYLQSLGGNPTARLDDAP